MLKKLKTDIKPGDTVRVHQIISGFNTDKEKTQIFEGIVLAHKHGKEPGASITVRGVIDGVGVERIFPLHSPLIKQIEITKRAKTRRAKLYYLRQAKGKRAKLKTKAVSEKVFQEEAPIKEKPKKETPAKEK